MVFFSIFIYSRVLEVRKVRTCSAQEEMTCVFSGGDLKEESCASNRVRQFKWFASANQKRAFLAVTITYGPIPSFGRRFVEDDVSAPLCDRLNRINLKKNGQGSDKKS